MQFYFHWGITEIKNGAFYVGHFMLVCLPMGCLLTFLFRF